MDEDRDKSENQGKDKDEGKDEDRSRVGSKYLFSCNKQITI
jgi:hypothetical protein